MSDEIHNHIEEIEKTEKTISIRVPQIKLPSLQAGVLILLIVVGVLQTAQLYGLNLKIASGQVSAGSVTSAASAPAAGSSTDSTTSSLPSMVGGC